MWNQNLYFKKRPSDDFSTCDSLRNAGIRDIHMYNGQLCE